MKFAYRKYWVCAAALAIWFIPAQSESTPQEPRFDRITIDSLDADAWTGIVFLATAYGQPAGFALQVGSWRGGFLDGNDMFNAVAEVGPHAPDASYCRLAWRHLPNQSLVILEWSRLDATTVIGRLTAAPEFHLVMEGYFPYLAGSWGTQGFYRTHQAQQAMTGERYFDNVFGPSARFIVRVDQPLQGSSAFASLGPLREIMKSAARLSPSITGGGTAGAAGLEFTTGKSGAAHFVAVLGWDEALLLNRAGALLDSRRIDSILQEKSHAYAERRPVAKGLFEGAPEAVGNSMFWNTLYASSNGLVFPSISRHWAHDWGGWVVGEWDCFFGSLLTSLEDKEQTAASIKAILLSQTETGLVPNIAAGSGITPDRSQPPVGSFAAWKEYQRFLDRDTLMWAYPRLKKWHQWWFQDRGDGQPWRDGNRDGLLEWGSDRGSTYSTGGRGFLQAAKWESGMDDSPMYDDAAYDPKTYTMNIDDVGLNSLYALDAECLAQIATILGKPDEAGQFTAEYNRMKGLIREKLWSEADGIYENRFWDGRFSSHLSPTNFYPMFAGIATPQQAERMVKEHLLNANEFWGKYVAPTIARDDPAFRDQFYWRGDIWGPTNYMLYEGLERYEFDDVAFQYAGKNYDLFMDDWRTNQHDDEQYHAWGGNGGGDTHYTWGALLCLVALDQYIDDNPWEGLRFGALSARSEGKLTRVTWQDHSFDVVIGPRRTALMRNGTLRFEADTSAVVRNYIISPSKLSFTIKSTRAATIKTSEFPSGKVSLMIDGHSLGQIGVLNAQATFSVPSGSHRVTITK